LFYSCKYGAEDSKSLLFFGCVCEVFQLDVFRGRVGGERIWVVHICLDEGEMQIGLER
jgi:hypothetical protein